MHSPNAALLQELEELGVAHDARTLEHDDRLLNVTRDTGAFLAILVRIARARRILEIGTSNGYSTVWLAEAALDNGGAVTTVEQRPARAALARVTFDRARGLAPITLEVGDAGAIFERSADQAWDLVFLDADRARYEAWWPHIRRSLAVGGLLVVDNAVSHAAEVAPLTAAVAAAPEFSSMMVPIGKGELVAHRGDAPAGR